MDFSIYRFLDSSSSQLKFEKKSDEPKHKTHSGHRHPFSQFHAGRQMNDVSNDIDSESEKQYYKAINNQPSLIVNSPTFEFTFLLVKDRLNFSKLS